MKLRFACLYTLIFITLFFSSTIFAQQTQKFFEPGKVWLDTDGKPIEAQVTSMVVKLAGSLITSPTGLE